MADEDNRAILHARFGFGVGPLQPQKKTSTDGRGPDIFRGNTHAADYCGGTHCESPFAKIAIHPSRIRAQRNFTRRVQRNAQTRSFLRRIWDPS